MTKMTMMIMMTGDNDDNDDKGDKGDNDKHDDRYLMMMMTTTTTMMMVTMVVMVVVVMVMVVMVVMVVMLMMMVVGDSKLRINAECIIILVTLPTLTVSILRIKPVSMERVTVRIGTDCSGTDAPIDALRQTALYRAGRIRIKHQWSCDKDPAAQQYIKLNHSPKEFYSNITSRNHDQLKKADIYVAGFPCQPFSVLNNNRAGFQDPRAAVYEEVIATLKTGKIRACILENVKGLLNHDEGRSFQRVMQDLRDAGFMARARLFRSTEFGIPQARPRLYFVAIRNDVGTKPHIPPAPCVSSVPLSTLLEPVKGPPGARPNSKKDSVVRNNFRAVLKRLKKRGASPNDTWVADIDSECYRFPPASFVVPG